MIKNKNKQSSDFSHCETEQIRATFIDSPKKSNELLKELEGSKTLKINVSEYLKTDDPIFKYFEILLVGFMPILNDAEDEVLYIKIKQEDKTIVYHLTAHPDTLTALQELSKDAISKGYTMIDLKVNVQQQADIMKKKLSGTLKLKKGTHPNMGYMKK